MTAKRPLTMRISLSARKAYADYLKAHVKIDKLWRVFQAIDNFAPPTD